VETDKTVGNFGHLLDGCGAYGPQSGALAVGQDGLGEFRSKAPQSAGWRLLKLSIGARAVAGVAMVLSQEEY